MSPEMFARKFPDDETCLRFVWRLRFPRDRHRCSRCGEKRTHHRLAGERCFSCAGCGHHTHPTAGTMFQDSRTPLRLWFLAIELFVRTGRLNAKELQRAFGVTYKCAWRMKALICERCRGARGLISALAAAVKRPADA